MIRRKTNHECVCRFPQCRVDTGRKLFFCDEHSQYRELDRSLFAFDVYDADALTGVYIVGSSKVGALKIGIASDIMGRLSQLQTGFPFRLAVYGAIFTRREYAARIERLCHDKLKEFGFHLNGEWFDVDADDADQ